MRPLRRRRLDDDVVVLPVLAAMGPRPIRRPRLQEYLEGFVEHLVRLFHRNAEAGELVMAIALSDAEIDAAAGQEIEGRDLLGQQHGIVPGQRDHGGPEPQVLRPRAHPGQEVQRGRDLTEAGEVVLDDERALVAERLGLDVVLDELAEPGAAVDVDPAPLGLGAPEEPETHDFLQ